MTDKQREYWREWYRQRYKNELKPAYDEFMKVYPFGLEDLGGEMWKVIPNFEDYQCSNFGRVKTLKNGEVKILRPSLDGKGYLVVKLYKKNKPKHFKVHRLVGMLFIPNPENLPEINHEDGCKLNCHVSNLVWTTTSENIHHAYKMGLIPKKIGEDSHRAKLTNEQAAYIIANPDYMTIGELAEKFSVGVHTIRETRQRKRFKNVVAELGEIKEPERKLTDAQVIFIRENPNNLTSRKLAEKFGVCQQLISAVQLGQRYQNVGGTIRGKIELRTPDEKREKIRELYATGQYTQKQLGEMFGITQAAVWNIVHEK